MEDLKRWMAEPEAENLEFKEAKSSYEFDKLSHYCAALSNEEGGRIVLGVSDKRPRRIVGTNAFDEPGRTVAGLVERLHIRISCTELKHPDGRVLVFEAPAHPIGVPIQADGIYWGRSGDALGPMRQEELRKIFDEADADFSAGIHPSAQFSDLDQTIIEVFRQMWRRKSGNPALDGMSQRQLLADAELIRGENLTYAGLVLLGSEQGLARHLPNAEVVFEYRANDMAVAHSQRVEYRKGFLGILEDLWKVINLRNELLHYQDGLFMRDIPVFNETVVREAVLNAVAHRDYRLPGSVFLKQFPRKLEIVSPGGFPAGITAENIVQKQSPRNRRIAEACARCGLVERSGQGADRMFEETIREGKARPDFTGTDDYEVRLLLLGDVQNPQFLRFLEKVGAEQQASFSLEELLVLDSLQRDNPVSQQLRSALRNLHERGIVERIGKGRGVKFILSHRFYSFLGKKGAYTRRKGLDRATHKALLLKHIDGARSEGAKLKDMQEVLKELSRAQIQTLLRELRTEGRVRVEGLTRAGRWHLI